MKTWATLLVAALTGGPMVVLAQDDHGNTRATATVVEAPSTTAGRIETRGDKDYFRFELPSETRLTVQTTGGTDTYGRLFRGDTLVRSNDDSESSLNFRITEATAQAGTWYVEVSEYGDNGTGAYTLQVELTEILPDDHGNTRATATVVEAPSATSGRLETRGDKDYFRFELPSAGRLTVQTTGDTDTYGRLFQGSSTTAAESDDDDGAGANFRIALAEAQAGTWYVEVSGYNGTATGAYSVQVEFSAQDDHGNTRATATVVEAPSATSGRLETRGDKDYFRFELPSAGRLTVQTTGDTDTYGRLFRGSSTTAAGSSNDAGHGSNFRIALAEAQAGPWYVEVSGNDGDETGAYSMQVEFSGGPGDEPATGTHTLPSVLPADSAGREGFLRIVNRSFQAGNVRIHAFDDTGERFGPITLALDAEEAVHLTSRDLERGSAAKGLPVGLGNGSGWWRLTLETDLALTPLAYVRTSDGVLTSMHDVVPVSEGAHRVLFFNPGSNTSKVSHLRIINPGTTEAEVTVTGRDDGGDEASGAVTLTLPAGGARTLTAQELEAGGDGLEGSLGDGAGKWRLTVTASSEIEVMSLLQTRTGHLSNVSTEPDPPASGLLSLPLVLPAADGASREGFMRIISRSGQAGTVSVTAIDDTGERFGPVVLELGAGGAVHLTSRDLEQGNAAKGLPEGVGDGEGSWRLELDSALDVVALGYIRTSDGFLTSMHDVVPVSAGAHRVPFFNPGSNTSKVSHLRIINSGTAEAEVTVIGRDDAGDEASGTVSLTLPAGGARTLTAQELEAGGEGFDGSLGDGAGKWRLTVTASRAIEVMSLLQTRTGHLSNVSTEPEMPPEGNPVAPPDAVPLALSDGTITGELDSPEDVSYYRVTSLDEPMILDLSASSVAGLVITVFDERGNMIVQSSPREAGAAQGQGDIEPALPILVVGAGLVLRAGVVYTVRIAATSAARTVIAGQVTYRLTKAVARLALRKVREFVRDSRIVYGTPSTSVDLSNSFEGESSVITGISVSPFEVGTAFGTVSVLSFDLNHTGRRQSHELRVGHRPNDACGTGSDYSLAVTVKLALSWNQRVPPPGFSVPIYNFGEVPLNIVRPGAPRRIMDTAESIAVRVATGATETITLTDYIEDPDGGALTFNVSGDVPSGWTVSRSGVNLTATAGEGAEDGRLTVTATDPAGECWNFPVQLTRTEGEVWGAASGFRRVGGSCVNASNAFIAVFVTDRTSLDAAFADVTAECERRRGSFPRAANCYAPVDDDDGEIITTAFRYCGAIAYHYAHRSHCGGWFGRGATFAAAQASAMDQCSRPQEGSCRIVGTACNSTVSGAERFEIRATQGERSHASDLDENEVQNQNAPSRMAPRSPQWRTNHGASAR